MRILSKTLLATVAAASVIAGSSCIIEHRFNQLSEADKKLYSGTQSGFHRLSEFFAVRTKNDHFRNTMKIYHYIDGKDAKELIGGLHVLTFDFADYGLPGDHFMLSKDGRTLLYHHVRGLNKPEGLYRFRHGEGDRLLCADVFVQGGNQEQHTLTFCAPASDPLHWKCRAVSADDP
jgi:hypothetical protein